MKKLTLGFHLMMGDADDGWSSTAKRCNIGYSRELVGLKHPEALEALRIKV